MTETSDSSQAPPMADEVSPPAKSPSPNPIPYTTSPESINDNAPRTRAPQDRLSSYNRSRLSTASQQRLSRPHSSVFPAFHSSLQYALVRDFAYPAFHPMHYGPPPEPPSGATTPGSEFSQSRRLSEPQDNSYSSSGRAGPWGGDGYLYPDQGGDFEALPSTSFGDDGDDDEHLAVRRSRHRQSRSLNNISEWEGGRRRESGSNDAMFHFSTSQLDPAGSESLRHSRGFTPSNSKRDSHFARTLSARSYHNSNNTPNSSAAARSGEDEDLIPLDSEASTHAQSPQRASMGPEDELFAGESLALYAFEPENPNELRLHEGQIILVSYRHGQGWLVAEDPATGEQGLVPEEYVRLVRDIEGWDAERGTFIMDGDEADADPEADVDDSDDNTNTQSASARLQARLQQAGDDDPDSGNSSEAVTDRPSRAMLAEPPDVDHDEGLSMNASLSPVNRKTADWKLDGEGDERRQDSGHADK